MQENYQYTNSKGTTYYLNTKNVPLRGGRLYPIYYFSKDQRPEGCPLPEGRTVRETAKSGLPVLAKVS